MFGNVSSAVYNYRFGNYLGGGTYDKEDREKAEAAQLQNTQNKAFKESLQTVNLNYRRPQFKENLENLISIGCYNLYNNPTHDNYINAKQIIKTLDHYQKLGKQQDDSFYRDVIAKVAVMKNELLIACICFEYGASSLQMIDCVNLFRYINNYCGSPQATTTEHYPVHIYERSLGEIIKLQQKINMGQSIENDKKTVDIYVYNPHLDFNYYWEYQGKSCDLKQQRVLLDGVYITKDGGYHQVINTCDLYLMSPLNSDEFLGQKNLEEGVYTTKDGRYYQVYGKTIQELTLKNTEQGMLVNGNNVQLQPDTRLPKDTYITLFNNYIPPIKRRIIKLTLKDKRVPMPKYGNGVRLPNSEYVKVFNVFKGYTKMVFEEKRGVDIKFLLAEKGKIHPVLKKLLTILSGHGDFYQFSISHSYKEFLQKHNIHGVKSSFWDSDDSNSYHGREVISWGARMVIGG